MKPVMTYPPTKSLRTQDVTYSVRASLAPLDHFRSIGELTCDSVPIPTLHHQYIPHSPELFMITAIHSRTRRHLVGNIQSP